MSEESEILLSPSILDRLIDYDRDDNGSGDDRLTPAEEAEESGFINMHRFDSKFLCRCVERDLNNLLRTIRSHADALPAHLGELSGSIYQYGLPDRTAFGFTVEATEQVAQDVRAAVAQFEPRLRNVSVSLESDAADPGLLHFVISGRVRARPTPQVIHFDARLSPQSKTFTVKERASHGATEDLLAYYTGPGGMTAGSGDVR